MNQSGRNAKYDIAAPAMSLNDNLVFQGKELHVQTENVQSDNPHIRTHVFFGGRVVYMKKCDFSADVLDATDFGTIREMMQAQHRKVMEKIHKLQTKRQLRD